MDPALMDTLHPRTVHLAPAFDTSLSRVRSRREQFTDNEVKPLLANLSPASTLETLVSTSAVPTTRDRSHSFVEASVVNATESERAWGIKAALAGKKIREWHDELAQWPWIGNEGEEGNGFQGMRDGTQIQERLDRIETIRDDMETLEVEELKDHVRKTHIRHDTNMKNYESLRDFTAVITAIIVQSLPTLSNLNTLLDTWSIRLLILRQVPSFLMDIKDCQESMISAWMAVGQENVSNSKPRPDFNRNAFSDIQAVLQDQISRLGRKTDGLLDMLEGSKDTLPDQWIDGVDRLENEYSSWVVKAEELVLNNEMEASSRFDCQMQHKIVKNVRDEVATNATSMPEDTVHRSPHQMKGVDGAGDSKEDDLGIQNMDHSTNNDNPLVTKAVSREESVIAARNLDQYESSDRAVRLMDRKPPPLNLARRSPKHSRNNSALTSTESDISPSGSATSEYFSDKSSPEILNASVASYLRSPVMVTTPKWSERDSMDKQSRPPSQIAEPGYFNLDYRPESPSFKPVVHRRQRSMTSPPELPIPQPSRVDELDSELDNPDHVRVRSASVRSFEKVATQDIRRLLVRRSGSYSPASPQKAPVMSQRNSVAITSPAPTPLKVHPVDGKASSMPMSTSSAKRFHKDLSSTPASPRQNERDRALVNKEKLSPVIPQQSEPEIAKSSARPCSRFEQVTDFEAGSAPIKVQKQRSSKVENLVIHQQNMIQTPIPKQKDKLEARISSILNHIPADIRLKTSPSTTPTPLLSNTRPRSMSTPKTPLIRRSLTPKLLRTKTPGPSSPSLTLAPAPPPTGADSKPIATKSTNANDPEIKLYHLHRTDHSSAPVKLYVRLVGENGDRVMVRVGGGWADLGEYLKEYAAHHGSKRSVSTASAFDFHTLPSTPGSGQKSEGAKTQPGTPKWGSRPGSRNSWAGDEASSPSLAGLKARDKEVDPERLAWVEGMLERARLGGNGGGKEGKSEGADGEKGRNGDGLGWLGRVGGTSRVFLKGGGG